MSEAVEAAIERLREKLIDLTANNRLINFRHGAGIAGSQSVLRFVGKQPDQVFARLWDQKSFYRAGPGAHDKGTRRFLPRTRWNPRARERRCAQPDRRTSSVYLASPVPSGVSVRFRLPAPVSRGSRLSSIRDPISYGHPGMTSPGEDAYAGSVSRP